MCTHFCEIMGWEKHQHNNNSTGIKYTIIIIIIVTLSLYWQASNIITFNPGQPLTRWLIIG